MDEVFMADLMIIGAGPAAWSCALTARQKGLTVAVAAAESATGWLQRAERIDNYPGMPRVSGRELLDVFRQQAIDAGVTVLPQQARLVMPMGPSDFGVLVGNGEVACRAVVLAVGAGRPELLPGEEENMGQGVSWCGTCDGMFFRNQDVAVLSAWQGGVEEAEFLATLAAKVDYYSLAKHPLPEAAPFSVCGGKPVSIRRAEDGMRLVVTTDDGAEHVYDGVFVFRPTVAPAMLLDGLELDGPFIRTNRSMETSVAGVFACGDCTGQPLQIAKAVGEGNVAAISAAEFVMKAKKELAE